MHEYTSKILQDQLGWCDENTDWRNERIGFHRRGAENARRTLEANEAQAETWLSDCAQAVLERRFDVVLCNPPFHQGVGVAYDVARQMVRDAAAVLRPGGRFYLVSNAFIRYEREMGQFAQVREVFNDRRYRVLRARH